MAVAVPIEVRVLDSEQGKALARIRELATRFLIASDSKTPGFAELQAALFEYANTYEVSRD